jgi:hypothetical protein
LQGRLVFVGLGSDTDLGEDGAVLVGVSGQQVMAGHRAVATAAQGLAIQRDGLRVRVCGGRRQARGDPARQGNFKGRGVEGAVQVGKARGSGCLATAEAQGVRQGKAVIAAELRDGRRALAATQHSQHGQRQQSRQRVPASVAATRVRHVRADFK